jgi:hypothetical protein
MDVQAAEEDITEYQEEIKELEADLQEETEAIVERWETALEQFEDVRITPRRADVEITLFALAWVPRWRIAYRIGGGSIVQTATVSAYS